jgi:hypothetical protein
MGQVFSQMTARKYYHPAVAGLSYSFSLGTRYAYFACWSQANTDPSSSRAGVQSRSSPLLIRIFTVSSLLLYQTEVRA